MKITVNVTEAAEMLSVSRPTMYEIMRREDFNGLFYIGKKPLILVAALNDWAARQAATQS